MRKLAGYFLVSLILPLALLLVDYLSHWSFPWCEWVPIECLRAFVGGYVLETVIVTFMLLGHYGEKLIEEK